MHHHSKAMCATMRRQRGSAKTPKSKFTQNSRPDKVSCGTSLMGASGWRARYRRRCCSTAFRSKEMKEIFLEAPAGSVKFVKTNTRDRSSLRDFASTYYL